MGDGLHRRGALFQLALPGTNELDTQADTKTVEQRVTPLQARIHIRCANQKSTQQLHGGHTSSSEDLIV